MHKDVTRLDTAIAENFDVNYHDETDIDAENERVVEYSAMLDNIMTYADFCMHKIDVEERIRINASVVHPVAPLSHPSDAPQLPDLSC